MFIQVTTILCAVQMLIEVCKCVKFFDLPSDSEEPNSIVEKKVSQLIMQYAPVNISMTGARRLVPRSLRRLRNNMELRARRIPTRLIDTGDEIKKKIRTLVDQSILDTNRTLISINNFKNKMKNRPEYKIGFITSYIKQECQRLNDFFDLAVNYREHAVVLQQLKVFEYIMRSNANITVLLRQMINTHIQYRDSKSAPTSAPAPSVETTTVSLPVKITVTELATETSVAESTHARQGIVKLF